MMFLILTKKIFFCYSFEDCSWLSYTIKNAKNFSILQFISKELILTFHLTVLRFN